MKFTPAITLLFMCGLSACMETEGFHLSQDASRNSNGLLSAYEIGNPFSNAACMISTRPKSQLPQIFVSPDYYTGSTEVGDERRVSAFKEYFMALGSRAKVNRNASAELRAVLLDIAMEDRFQRGQGWEENSSNVFYFAASALFPIALEYYHHKEQFSANEHAIIDSYLLRQWRQLGRTKVLTIPRIDNKYALYGAVSYAVGLATDNAAAKRAGIKSYQRVINAMRRDGSNPLDSGRGGSAIHYTVLGISSLVATAELSLIDGVDLFGYSGRNGDLNQAISFLISATRDPSIIAGYAAKNESGFSEYSPENQDRRWVSKDLAAWITVYERRFPDSPVTEQLLALTSRAPLRSALVSDHIGGNALCWTSGR